jgi:hypothetical protein
VWISYQIGAGFGLLFLDVGYSNNSESTVEISVIGLGDRIEAKLVGGSEESGGGVGFESVEQRLVVLGSGGDGVEREGLGELGGCQ